MSKSKNNHTIDVVFVLAIACAFAASILTVLMLGINIYSNIQNTANEEFKERVCLSYISAKIHRNDSAGEVRTDEFDGLSALFLDKEIDGDYYTTVIYAYDGWLRELLTDRASLMDDDPWQTHESGLPVLEVDYVSFDTVKPNLLSIEYLDKKGGGGKMFVSLRSEGGGDI